MLAGNCEITAKATGMETIVLNALKLREGTVKCTIFILIIIF